MQTLHDASVTLYLDFEGQDGGMILENIFLGVCWFPVDVCDNFVIVSYQF